MTTARKGEIHRVVEGGLFEAGLQDVERKPVRRKIGRTRDLAECHAAVGATDRELAGGEFDVLLTGLEQVASDLSALVDDFSDRLGDGGAADRGRARTISTETKGAARCVAMDDLDEIARHAEHVADELSEDCLMALAVTMRAGEDGDVARGIDADIGALEKSAAGAKLASDT
jgi:hypothetical protein